MIGTYLFKRWKLTRSKSVTMCNLRGLWFRKKKDYVNPRDQERTPIMDHASFVEKQDTRRGIDPLISLS